LRFALRRTTAAVAVLATMRTTGTGADTVPLGLAAPDRAEVARVVVPRLGVGALHHVLRSRLGSTFSRPMVARLAHESGGNALLAIEMARAMLRLRVMPGPADDLPVVASMQ